MASILIRNIKALGGIRNKDIRTVKGNAMREFPVIENAYLFIEEGLIKALGNNAEAPERADKIIEAEGRFVLPCWCDSHTHIVYAGTRENEFVYRIHGHSYEEIAKKGGGILNSAKKMVHAGEEDLFDSAWLRLDEMEKYGTGAVEIKSGYGLSYAGEMKMLRVIRKLKEKSRLTIKATFLGAHAYPAAYKEDHQGYLDLLIHQMIPEIAGEGLADFVDVFCDRGFFSAAETDLILQAGAKYNLPAKIHANELDYSGGIETGVKNKALSVDHLEFTGDEQIKVLLQAETMPSLLPSTAFFLGLQYAPARKMIDAGLPIALASDFNPGSSPSGNMQLVIALACIQMKMLPEESLNAATLNSAYAMGVEEQLGSICIGKKANIIITKPIPSLAYLPYSFGSNCVEQVIIS
jgi:imidazolonepropionase